MQILAICLYLLAIVILYNLMNMLRADSRNYQRLSIGVSIIRSHTYIYRDHSFVYYWHLGLFFGNILHRSLF